MRVTRYLLGFALVVLAQLDMNAAEAFNGPTHESMNKSATNASSLNDFLEHDLAFEAGVNQPFKATRAIDWIAEGGRDEDDPNSRSFHHFHDPLRPWNDAGLQLPQLPLVPRFESSIVWMQDDDGADAGADGAAQGWSWPDARRSYYHALTLTTKQDREQKWADTFRAVGQVMHLIEDAASPAHVRNDPHGLEYICQTYLKLPSCGGNFEYWVEKHPETYSYSGAAPILPIILELPTLHSEAPVPVAHLIDNDIYIIGGNANVTVGPLDENGQEITAAPVGLAEFTNANFFSEDTVSTVWYPFPSLDPNALVPVTVSAPRGVLPRQYYAKAAGHGYPVNPLVAEGVFDEAVNNTIGWLAPRARFGSVDENVWQAYADILVPKAVVYAQGALDYFFRGKIDLVADLDHRDQFILKNLGPEPLSGTFRLYADDAAGTRALVPGAEWQQAVPSAPCGAESPDCNQVSVSAPSGTVEPPANGTYTLVFCGQIGNEGHDAVCTDGAGQAVAGKVVELPSFLSWRLRRQPIRRPLAIMGGTGAAPRYRGLARAPSFETICCSSTVATACSNQPMAASASVTCRRASSAVATRLEQSCTWAGRN